MKRNPKRIDKQLEKRIGELAGRLSELKRNGGGKIKAGLPDVLRAEILAAWRDSSMPMGPFGARIGVSGQSIANWRKAAEKKAKPAPKRKEQFQEIRVVPECAAKLAPAPRRSIELALPGGARVTGLGLDDIAQLLGMQGVLR